MSPLARRQLGKLDYYQANLRELWDNYRTASILATVSKWTVIAGAAIVLIKLIPGVNYHQIGLTLSGIAGGAALLALLIWFEQRAKATQLLRESWALSDKAKAEGVRLAVSGRIDRDDLGEPINPFPLLHDD